MAKEMDAYLAEIASFGNASKQVWGALSDGDTGQGGSRDELKAQADERRQTMDAALRRANEAHDHLLAMQERTGAGDVPRQIVAAGRGLPDWAAAEGNLEASTARLEQAEVELDLSEQGLNDWHVRRGARARRASYVVAGVVTFLLVMAFLLDLGARFSFFSGMTFLLVVGGALFVTGLTAITAVMLRHPDVTRGAPLRTAVNVDGLVRLCVRTVLPVFLVLLVIRVLIGIVLTVAGWFS